MDVKWTDYLLDLLNETGTLFEPWRENVLYSIHEKGPLNHPQKSFSTRNCWLDLIFTCLIDSSPFAGMVSSRDFYRMLQNFPKVKYGNRTLMVKNTELFDNRKTVESAAESNVEVKNLSEKSFHWISKKKSPSVCQNFKLVQRVQLKERDINKKRT